MEATKVEATLKLPSVYFVIKVGSHPLEVCHFRYKFLQKQICITYAPKEVAFSAQGGYSEKHPKDDNLKKEKGDSCNFPLSVSKSIEMQGIFF